MRTVRQGPRHGGADRRLPAGRAAGRPEQEAAYTWDTPWSEVRDLAAVFGVPERGEELVKRQQQTLEEVAEAAPGDGIDVLVWDMDTDTPLVVAGGGGPQLILDEIGPQ